MKVLNKEEKETASHLKANLWLTVAKIVERELESIDHKNQVTATPQFVASLVELVYNQALSLGEDLESFANHAKRKTVQPEDLYMATRRNDVLTSILQEFAAAESGRNEAKGSAAARSDAPAPRDPEPETLETSESDFADDDELFAKV